MSWNQLLRSMDETFNASHRIIQVYMADTEISYQLEVLFSGKEDWATVVVSRTSEALTSIMYSILDYELARKG